MSTPTIELVHFDGCPNADQARENLRAVVGEGAWREWNLSSESTPERYRRFGSPTVLIAGEDVTASGDAAGSAETSGAMACRAEGAPSISVIRDAVERHG
ncbi:MAG: hypothetical protein RQ745_07740 [Longimicrobiales bacterium]|nr:hypothetical protein [Longimicrobiales bacterium]